MIKEFLKSKFFSILLFIFLLAISCLYFLQKESFQITGHLAVPRQAPSSQLLDQENILIISGDKGNNIYCTSERYNLATGKSSGSVSLGKKCSLYDSISLNKEVFLISNDFYGIESPNQVMLYNELDNTYKKSVSPNISRHGFTINRLNAEEIMVIGGYQRQAKNKIQNIQSSEIYNLKTGRFKIDGKLIKGRHNHQAFLLADKNILVIGGVGDNQEIQKEVELYETQKRKFKIVGYIDQIGNPFLIDLIGQNKIIIINKENIIFYDLATKKEKVIENNFYQYFPTCKRFKFSSLSNGKILLSCSEKNIPGYGDKYVGLYEPNRSRFMHLGQFKVPRTNYGVFLAPTQKLFIIGGQSANAMDSDNYLDSIETINLNMVKGWQQI